MIYLDNAATTFPKPREVINEVTQCIKYYCGNPGRSSHFLSMRAAQKIYECRVLAADFFGSPSPEKVFFTLNTTYALNTVIKGILKRGDHVIISDFEHNSVYRPIYKMTSDGIITYNIFHTVKKQNGKDYIFLSDEEICNDILRLIQPNTKLLICTHIPNICSRILPVQKIGEICRQKGVFFALDAAQSAGHIPINISDMNIDFLCAPSHKGLYGIQGGGLVVINKDVQLDTLVEGGNGISSLESRMPDITPERYESGTLPTPALAGLCEGIKKLNEIGLENISEHEKTLFVRAREMLENTSGITVYAKDFCGSVILFNLNGISPDTVSRELNDEGICVRSGFHCSALGHRTLGSVAQGAVRASLSIFNTTNDIEAMYRVLKDILKSKSSQ